MMGTVLSVTDSNPGSVKKTRNQRKKNYDTGYCTKDHA